MTRPKRWLSVAAFGAVLAMLLLAGCSGADPESQPAITEQQALARVNQLLQDTGPSITPRPHLVADRLLSDSGPCVDEPEGMSDARVQVSRGYLLEGIPEQENASIAGQILRTWKARGYVVSDTFHMDTVNPQIHGGTKDGFLIALESNGQGQLHIGATSPCVWPNGTPSPRQ